MDPWILRAVYEEVSSHCAYGGTPFPVRAEDVLEADLGIQSQELDWLAEDIATRTKRPLERAAQNPMYDRVRTVADLVWFFVHQPRDSTA